MTEHHYLSNAELDEIAARLAKGWVIRRETIEALVKMARALNARNEAQTAAPNTPGYVTVVVPCPNARTP